MSTIFQNMQETKEKCWKSSHDHFHRTPFCIILTSTLFRDLSRNTCWMAEKNYGNNLGLPVFYTAGLHKSDSDEGNIAAKKTAANDKGSHRGGYFISNFPITWNTDFLNNFILNY